MENNENEIKVLKIEAEEAVREVSFAVKYVEVSKELPSSDECIYLNLRTKENDVFCVELSISGFRVVAKEFNKISEEKNKYYETIYQLLDSISPEYRNSFGNALMTKLSQLQQNDA